PGDGTNSVSGGPGNDRFVVSSTDADEVHGGAGKDLVSYHARAGPMDISLAGSANDGLAGEGDNVFPDVENVIGSNGADRIVGSAPANMLIGLCACGGLLGMGAQRSREW